MTSGLSRVGRMPDIERSVSSWLSEFLAGLDGVQNVDAGKGTLILADDDRDVLLKLEPELIDEWGLSLDRESLPGLSECAVGDLPRRQAGWMLLWIEELVESKPGLAYIGLKRSWRGAIYLDYFCLERKHKEPPQPPGDYAWYAYPPDNVQPRQAVTMEHCEIFEVDGETFDVEWHDISPFKFHADWLSGPNPGYGFSGAGGDAPPSRSEMQDTLRNFLKQVNPKTGYIDEDY